LYAFEGHNILFAGFFAPAEASQLRSDTRSEVIVVSEKKEEGQPTAYYLLHDRPTANIGYNYAPEAVERFESLVSGVEGEPKYGLINTLYGFTFLEADDKFIIESYIHKNVGLLVDYILSLNKDLLDDPEYTLEDAAEDVANFALESRFMFVPLNKQDAYTFEFASKEQHVFNLKRKLPKYIKITNFSRRL